MFYALRGLSGLPPLPPHEGDHQWVRYYEVDDQHQLKVCPTNPPLGCWIIGGYAWGKREVYSEEFSPAGFVLKPLPKPFPHPTPVAPSPPPSPTYKVHTFKLQPPGRQTTDTQPNVTPTHETSGVGAVVGVGLFVAIGLTLLL